MEQIESFKTALVSSHDPRFVSLRHFGEMIFESNRNFNLTGFKTIEEIMSGLIADSAKPLLGLDVPRGTSIVDLGSGSGAPGLVAAIMMPEIHVTCCDSSVKKTDFIAMVISRLGLKNSEVLCCRIEDLGRDLTRRGMFDAAISRAMAHPLAAVELSAPLMRNNGFLYLYSNDSNDMLHPAVVAHAEAIGLSPGNASERRILGIGADGFLFFKRRETPDRYPRSYSAIKRDVERVRG